MQYQIVDVVNGYVISEYDCMDDLVPVAIAQDKQGIADFFSEQTKQQAIGYTQQEVNNAYNRGLSASLAQSEVNDAYNNGLADGRDTERKRVKKDMVEYAGHLTSALLDEMPVKFVKAYRSITGLGLKEAKKAYNNRRSFLEEHFAKHEKSQEEFTFAEGTLGAILADALK